LGRTFEAIKHDILILQAKANHPAIKVDLGELYDGIVDTSKLDTKADRPMKYQHILEIPKIQLVMGASYRNKQSNVIERWQLIEADTYENKMVLERVVGPSRIERWTMTWNQLADNFTLDN
jgi:hypothetical protein